MTDIERADPSDRVLKTVGDVEYARTQLRLVGDGDTALAIRVVDLAYMRARDCEQRPPLPFEERMRRWREEFPPGTVTSQRVEAPWWAFWRR